MRTWTWILIVILASTLYLARSKGAGVVAAAPAAIEPLITTTPTAADDATTASAVREEADQYAATHFTVPGADGTGISMEWSSDATVWVRDVSGNWVPYPRVLAQGSPTVWAPGDFKYGPDTYVPDYPSAVLLALGEQTATTAGM